MIARLRCCFCVAASVICAAQASAVELFSDNFNTTGSSALWQVNAAPTANAGNQSATFAFNYGTLGIPAAPGSNDTLGLRLRANIPGTPDNPVTTRPVGTISGLSLSPVGMNFGTNYQLEFYAWSNHFGFNGNLADNVNSPGGTNNVLFAVGTSGTAPMVLGNPNAIAGGAPDGVAFATTGDGGIGNDYRVFAASGTFTPGTTAGVYAAGADVTAVQSSNAFYTAMFPPVAAPAVQADIAAAEFSDANLNPMLGTSQAGSFGFAWQKVTIVKNGNTVTWSINDALIATVDAAALTLGGANIAIGVSDVNTSTARYPSLVFTVFDNLVVTSLPSAGPAGDFTGDGVVDGADFLKWQRGESPSPLSAADLATWKAGFGTSAAALSVSAVPEPATIAIGLLGAAAMGVAARRRR
jgi:hypothetical protein